MRRGRGCAFSSCPLAHVDWKAFQWSATGRVEKIDNIMVVREFIIVCGIKHHSGSPITIDYLIF